MSEKTFLTQGSPKPGARQELPGEGPVASVGAAKEGLGEGFIRKKHEGDEKKDN